MQKNTLLVSIITYFESACIMNTHKTNTKKYPSGYNKAEFNDTYH